MQRGLRGLPARVHWVLLIVAGILTHFSYGVHLNALRWKRDLCRRNQFECNSGTCVGVFHLCDGVKHCDDGSDEIFDICSTKTCPSQAFRCEYGACIDKVGLCNGVEECADGSDERSNHCDSKISGSASRPSPGIQPALGSGFQVTCPALMNPTREIECQLNNREVDCAKPMIPGTKATVQCYNYYTNGDNEFRFQTVCQPNGNWSRNVTRCIPKCGERDADGLPFIAGGVKIKSGDFPWHAGVYRFENGIYVQVCGGNIISERVIVTGAHCFWNDVTRGIVDVTKDKIAVGKYYREWNHGQDTSFQTPEIEKVILHRQFRGSRRSWESDVAVVILKDAIRMTAAIRPICVDYNKQFNSQFIPGMTGKIVGWGVTETMRPSEVLHTSTIPYVSFEDCEKEVPSSFLAFLTNDKFCAGYRNGTSVCPGDGGGGFATQFRDGKWYLMGISSIGVPASNANACNIYQYTTFTRISEYIDFIKDNKLE